MEHAMGRQRIVYFGSGAFGLPTLESLHEQHQISLIVTQPDRKAGRGSKLTPTPIARWAQDHAPNLPILKPEKVNDPAVVESIRKVSADAWVVIAFGQYLGRSLLADRFAINLHASLLPRWRGAGPIHAAILAGDEQTGNSVITLAKQMDAGDVLGQTHRPIEADMTAGQLHDLLAEDGPALVQRVLSAHAQSSLVAQAQNPALVTIAPKLSRADAWVDFAQSARVCARRINGLSPWPGVQATLNLNNKTKPVTLKLLRVHPIEKTSEHVADAGPGEFADPKLGLLACGNGTTLQLLEVQPAGKKAMPWADFARGREIAHGATLISVRSKPDHAICHEGKV